MIVLTSYCITGRKKRQSCTKSEHFAPHVRWVYVHRDLVHPDELQARARLDGPRCGTAVAAIFNDGYRDYNEVAYPLLKELEIPVLAFLAPAFVGADAIPWTKELNKALPCDTLGMRASSRAGQDRRRPRSVTRARGHWPRDKSGST